MIYVILFYIFKLFPCYSIIYLYKITVLVTELWVHIFFQQDHHFKLNLIKKILTLKERYILKIYNNFSLSSIQEDLFKPKGFSKSFIRNFVLGLFTI